MKTLCPYCQQTYDVEDNMTGVEIGCSACNNKFAAQPAQTCPHCQTLNASEASVCSYCQAALTGEVVPVPPPMGQMPPPMGQMPPPMGQMPPPMGQMPPPPMGQMPPPPMGQMPPGMGQMPPGMGQMPPPGMGPIPSLAQLDEALSADTLSVVRKISFWLLWSINLFWLYIPIPLYLFGYKTLNYDGNIAVKCICFITLFDLHLLVCGLCIKFCRMISVKLTNQYLHKLYYSSMCFNLVVAAITVILTTTSLDLFQPVVQDLIKFGAIHNIASIVPAIIFRALCKK